jgi:hypothetical protein
MYYLSADDPNSWNGTAVWTDLMGTGVNMNLTGLSTPGLSSVPASFGPINSKWVGFSSVSAQYGYTNGEFQRSVYLKWTVEVWIQMTNNNTNLVTQSASGFTPGWSGGNASGGIHIMRRWDSAEYFDGALNTVRIYNRALSPSEVLINFVSESRDRGWVRKT